MAEVQIVEAQAHKVHGLVLIDSKDQVWLTFSRPWWDLASIFWWWLYPGKKMWVIVRKDNGQRVRVRAVRIARKFIRIGTRP